MQIVDAEWTEKVNYLIIECRCGNRLKHRADRWKVYCPCGQADNLQWLREKYLKESPSSNSIG